MSDKPYPRHLVEIFVAERARYAAERAAECVEYYIDSGPLTGWWWRWKAQREQRKAEEWLDTLNALRRIYAATAATEQQQQAGDSAQPR